MGEDAAGVSETARDEVMAAIDSDTCGPRLVIADINADDSWVSMPATAAPCLTDWR
ncbi:MAG: hypothetical protein U5J98_03060 [Halobacteriales archaeon]|nr:hypothetical protein [Halobacteriales archaeon]